MRLLLDTHTLLWWVEDDPQLSPAARDSIGDENNECLVSLVSAWEMAIKTSLGKLRLTGPVLDYFQQHLPGNNFRRLDITLEHVTRVQNLPLHHRDPFDRLLLAQAQQERLALVSADAMVLRYGIERIW